MNISGVVVRAKPEKLDAVWQQLETVTGVEVHGANPDGRLVVTVEESTDQQLADTVLGLQNLPGVLSASMIYHQFENESDLQEA